ncbi:hypothetical protein [Arthrobacter sp. 162MFSha1.1]|uniref:hypothetical protein n=1 Tax=Arthrobacter sp. 162MFSha1.1 TaxID=1151119 RepID=UPI00036FDC99|nr:hypothetical protein [Arthrobacter sp. 162MFSha1.1]
MTTETIITAGYHRPDVAVKLEILRERFGYTEAKAGLLSESVTLAVVQSGELKVLESRLERHLGDRLSFIPKKHRTSDVTLNVDGIIGHVGGYSHTSQVAMNAQAEFNRITAEDVRAHLAKKELAAQEDAARQAAQAIDRICQDLQAAQDERQAADARILALMEQHEESAIAA